MRTTAPAHSLCVRRRTSVSRPCGAATPRMTAEMALTSQLAARHSSAVLANSSALMSSASNQANCATASRSALEVMTNMIVTSTPVCQASSNVLEMEPPRPTAYQWHRVVMATRIALWEAKMNSIAHQRLVQPTNLNATTAVAFLMYGPVMEIMIASMDQMSRLTARKECALQTHSAAHLAAAFPWPGAVMATMTVRVAKMKVLHVMRKP